MERGDGDRGAKAQVSKIQLRLLKGKTWNFIPSEIPDTAVMGTDWVTEIYNVGECSTGRCVVKAKP